MASRLPAAHEATDEATGLPPLAEVDEMMTLVVVDYTAQEGLVGGSLIDPPVPARYLSLRGLMLPPPDAGHNHPAEWYQVHVAVPVDIALDVAAALAKGTTESLDGS